MFRLWLCLRRFYFFSLKIKLIILRPCCGKIDTLHVWCGVLCVHCVDHKFIRKVLIGRKKIVGIEKKLRHKEKRWRHFFGDRIASVIWMDFFLCVLYMSVDEKLRRKREKETKWREGFECIALVCVSIQTTQYTHASAINWWIRRHRSLTLKCGDI